MKTQAEVTALKANWVADPCWDLETTEGFEDHHDELAAFSRAMEMIWKDANRKRLEDKADELGVPGNMALAQYITMLERRIDELSQALENVYFSK